MWNLILAVYHPLISVVRFLMLKTASSGREKLLLYFSSSSYQSGVALSFQDTRIPSFSVSECQLHSISRTFGYKEEVSFSWTDVPTVLSRVCEMLGLSTVWKLGEGIAEMGKKKWTSITLL